MISSRLLQHIGNFSKATASALISICLVVGSAQAANDAKDAAKLKLLTADEVMKLSPKSQFRYFEELGKLLNALEKETPLNIELNESKKNAALMLFLPEVFAQSSRVYRAGDSCIIGGYLSVWYDRGGGSLSCGLPDEKLPNPHVYRTLIRADEKTRCTMSTGRSGVACNPRIYGMTASGESHCVSVHPSLSDNCLASFRVRYGDGADVAKLKDDLRKLFERPNDRLSYNELMDEIGRVYEAATRATDPGLSGVGQDVSKRSVVAAVGMMQKALYELKSEVENATAPKPQPQQPAPTNPPASKLGELACIEQGLRDSGHGGVSDRYIALLGTAVQANQGPFRTDDPELLQTRVIQMIQAYGYCDTSEYHPMTDSEAAQARRLLNADRGMAVNKSGIAYLNSVADGKGEAMVRQLFGIGKAGDPKSDFATYFKHSNDEWLKLSPKDRQKEWKKQNKEHTLESVPMWSKNTDGGVPVEERSNKRTYFRDLNSSQWNGCRENALKRIDQSGEAWDLPAVMRKSGYFSSSFTKKRNEERAVHVGNKSYEVCGAMTKACGLSDEVCYQIVPDYKKHIETINKQKQKSSKSVQ